MIFGTECYYLPYLRQPRQRNEMDYLSHIQQDPSICGGEPVIKGTRVTLRTVLASLAEGAGIEEILADFPTLSADDVRAAIAFAAASAEEDLPVPALPRVA
jgi:uncharacterized protein (DUF433 family)